jgi:hypothetical protein
MSKRYKKDEVVGMFIDSSFPADVGDESENESQHESDDDVSEYEPMDIDDTESSPTDSDAEDSNAEDVNSAASVHRARSCSRRGRGRGRGRVAGISVADDIGNISDEGEAVESSNAAGDMQGVADNWNKTEHDPPDFPFDRTNIGLQVQIPADADPGFYFSLIVDDNLIDCMVEGTNIYAEQVINKNRPLRRESRLKDWKPTDSTEMKRFLGLLLQMGPVVLPTLSHYWSKNAVYSTGLWKHCISRNRFQILLRMWHFANNQDDNGDRLFKVAPLISHFNSKMREIYKPDRELAIDESMVLWRGRLVFRQYIKNKRHKYGIKLFELSESSGMLLRVCIYSGEAFDDSCNLGQCAAVVLHLMGDYLAQGHILHTDNYYNSVALTEKMTQQSTYIVGTLRPNRKRNPKDVIRRKLKRGEFDWSRSGSVVVCKWRDKREVLTISNMHKVDMVEVTNRHGQKKLKPNIIRDYNKGMSGIDRSDQMLSYYSALRKTIRWYKKIGLHTLEMMMHNAHMMYNAGRPVRQTMRLLQFREAVVRYLIGGDLQPTRGPVAASTAHVPSTLPPTAKKPRPTKPCRICTRKKKRRETRYFCDGCEEKPALCVAPCFGEYHEHKD